MSPQIPSRSLLEQYLPERQSWARPPAVEELKRLPHSPAVFLLCDAQGRSVLLATTQALRSVVASRMQAPSTGGPQPLAAGLQGGEQVGRPPRGRARADLAEIVRELRWRPVCCALEARWWYFRLARLLYPHEYHRLVSFGPAWFLHVDWSAPIPQLSVTQQIWTIPGVFAGPWPAQAACQQALEVLWELFDLCRYPEQVRRAPAGKRCSYADMGRCDSPCDGSAPLAAYAARTQAAWRFVCGAVDDWLAEARERMQAAAAGLAFERAAFIRQQVALAERWRERWLGRVRPDHAMKWLLVLPVPRRRAWKLLVFRLGAVEDGPVLADHELLPRAVAWTAERLSEPLAESDPLVRMEQTWLMSSWFGSRDAASAVVQPLDTPAWSEQLTRKLAGLSRRPSARNGLRPPHRKPPLTEP